MRVTPLCSCLRVLVNKKTPNLEKTTSRVLSVLLIIYEFINKPVNIPVWWLYHILSSVQCTCPSTHPLKSADYVQGYLQEGRAFWDFCTDFSLMFFLHSRFPLHTTQLYLKYFNIIFDSHLSNYLIYRKMIYIGFYAMTNFNL